MKKVLGGKFGVCPHYGGLMVYLQVKYIGTVSQCKSCGCLREGRVKDEVKIYAYSEERHDK